MDSFTIRKTPTDNTGKHHVWTFHHNGEEKISSVTEIDAYRFATQYLIGLIDGRDKIQIMKDNIHG
jgi:hypothetical protein